MKRLLFIMLVALAALPAVAFSYTYEGKTINYSILSATDKTVKTADGNSQFAGNKVYGDLIIPSKVIYKDEEYTVTAIGDYAFYKSNELTTVKIPNSVTSIGNYAFSSCYALTSVEIPNSVTSIGKGAFYNCSSLTTVEIPNSVTDIGISAFASCFSLTTVEIPNSVTDIGISAFASCSSLTTVEIPNSVTSIGAYAFSRCGLTSVTIPNSVTSISSSAFSDCRNLTTVKIPNSVTSLGSSAFAGCSGLTTVKIPNSVTSLGNQVFYQCTGLTSVEIPNTITCISDSTFYGCTSLITFEIPNWITSIGKEAFSRCRNLTTVEIPNSVTSIGSYAFAACGLTSVTIPNSVTYIGAYAFTQLNNIYFNAENCVPATTIYIQASNVIIGKDVKQTDKIFSANAVKHCVYPATLAQVPTFSTTTVMLPYPNTAVIEDYTVYDADKTTILCGPWITGEYTVPSSVTSIGVNAFKNNTGLSTVTLSSALKSIGANAFEGCTGLTSLTLPSALKSIGANAFTGCSLANIYSSVSPAPVIDESSFTGLYDTATLNIPEALTGEYNNSYTNWRLFGTQNLEGVCYGEVFEADGLKYQYLTENTVKVIASESYAGLTDVSIPATLQVAVEPQVSDVPQYKIVSVEAIGTGAFAGLEGLTSVEVAEGVTTIGSMAFKGCTALTDVSLPATVTEIESSVFDGCSSLSTFDFAGISKIGSAAFAGTKLTSVSLPDAGKIYDYAFVDNPVASLELNMALIERIGNGAFKNSALTVLTLKPENSLTIGDEAFESSSVLASVTLGDNVKSVGNNAFKGCSKLKTLIVGKDVASIGDNAFDGCGLTSLSFVKDGALRSIGSNAFPNTKVRYTLDLPDALEYIGDRAFYNASGYAKIVIPANRRLIIGNEAFAQAQRATEIEFPETIAEIGEGAFKNNACQSIVVKADYIKSEAFTDNGKLKTITVIGEGTISDNAFKANPELTEAIINTGKIGKYIFSESTKLESVTFGDNVKVIGERAFSDNTSLSKVHFGLGLEEIGRYAFYNAPIDSISFPSAPVPDPKIVIGQYCFTGALRHLSLGNRVKEIGKNAGFSVRSNADNPTPYVDLGTSVETIGENGISIYIPKQAVVVPPSLRSITNCYIAADTINIPESPYEITVTVSIKSYLVAKNYYVNRRISETMLFRSWGDFLDIVFGDNKDAEITLSYSMLNGTPVNVHIGASVKKINGFKAKNFTFDEGVEEINLLTINGTKPLRLPASLKKLNSPSSSTLTELIISDSDEPLEIGKACFSSLKALKSLYLGRNISEATGSTLCSSNTTLESVIIGDKVSRINDGFFKGCTALTKAVMSDNVSEIGSEAFRGCTGLDILSLSENVSNIGENAYADCTGFSRIVARGMTPPEGAAGFGVEVEENVPLYVPDEVLDDYRDSDLFYWFDNINGFNDNIVEEVTADGDIDSEFTVGSKFNIFDVLRFVVRLFGQAIHKAPVAKAPARAAAEEGSLKYLWFAPTPEIASVDQEGNVTVNREGEAEIWAYALDGSDRKVVIDVNKFEELGDFNKDGVVDSSDLQLLINHVLNPSISTLPHRKADLNSDDTVDSADLQHHVNTILNKI